LPWPLHWRHKAVGAGIAALYHVPLDQPECDPMTRLCKVSWSARFSFAPKFFLVLCLVWALPASSADAEVAPADETLIALLDEFLAGASRNDVAVHERFWSDDLVYTSSKGERFGKKDIIEPMRSATAKEEGPAMSYGREALLVRVYGDSAVITFRLVATTLAATQGEPESVARLYNTGVFLNRNGEWRAIAWQATRIPEAAQ
jgi:ketosteroid isomerase-like protein